MSGGFSISVVSGYCLEEEGEKIKGKIVVSMPAPPPVYNSDVAPGIDDPMRSHCCLLLVKPVCACAPAGGDQAAGGAQGHGKGGASRQGVFSLPDGPRPFRNLDKVITVQRRALCLATVVVVFLPALRFRRLQDSGAGAVCRVSMFAFSLVTKDGLL